MFPPVALFIPGMVELLSVLVVLFVTFGIPLVAAIAVYHFYDGKNAYEERIETLERRVDQLERDRPDD